MSAPAALLPPTVAPLVHKPRRRGRWALAAVLTLLSSFVAWWVGTILVGQNLHTVVPGRVYRSAQPAAASLRRIVQDHSIRTVVNLRGSCNPLPWYLDESRTSAEIGISQEDLSFSAIHLPPPSELRELIDVLDHAEYPILLHCRHGADRTGMASAIVLLLQDGVPYAEARRELGIRYGHLSFGKTIHIDRFFELYERWLAANGKSHSPAHFRYWVLNEYRGGWCAGRVERVEPIGSLKAGHPLGFRVRLHNQGDAAWHFKPTLVAGVHVFFRLYGADGITVFEGRAGFLEATVGSGERFDVTMVVPPQPAGTYRLSVDLVEEFHCWFVQVGAEPWEEEIVVRE